MIKHWEMSSANIEYNVNKLIINTIKFRSIVENQRQVKDFFHQGQFQLFEVSTTHTEL